MTKEEKIQQVMELLELPGNAKKAFIAVVAMSLPSATEEMIDNLIRLLEQPNGEA